MQCISDFTTKEKMVCSTAGLPTWKRLFDKGYESNEGDECDEDDFLNVVSPRDHRCVRVKKNISEKLGSRAEGGDSDDCDSSEDFR